MTSNELLSNENQITEDDEKFWGSLLDKVKLNEQSKPAQQIEVAPKPAFCVKTKNKEGVKVFLNICTCSDIPEPRKISLDDLVKLLDSEEEMLTTDYRIPMSIGDSCHAELDKKGVGCNVYDVAINPNYIKTLQEEPAFMNFFLQIVFEGLSSKFEIELEWEWLILKNRSHVGSIRPHTIRTFKKPVIQELESSTAPKKDKPILSNLTAKVRHSDPAPKPDYMLVQDPPEGAPLFLLLHAWLPGVQTSSRITLDVGEDKLTIHAHPAKYFLDIEIPYDVTPEASEAYFVKESCLLTVVMKTVKES